MNSLEAAQLHLISEVHQADGRHRDGVSLSAAQLWQLATAAAEVSRLLGSPWVLQQLPEARLSRRRPQETASLETVAQGGAA